MKVAMIDPSLFTLPYDLKLIGGLETAGQDVTFYGKPVPDEEVIATGIRVVPHFYRPMGEWGLDRLPRPLFKVAKGLCHIEAMGRLARDLKRLRPDIIHFQWLPLPIVDRRYLRSLREVAPLVLTAHDSQPFNNSPGAAIQQMGAIEMFRRFDRVVVHTEQSRMRLESYGVVPERIARIDHGFLNDDEPVAPPPAIDPGRPVRFVLFGKLKPYKGADILIEAATRLAPEDAARCEIVIIGRPYMDTAPLEAAAARARAKITFDFRFVPEEELTQVLLGSDVLIFPYREIEVSGVLMASLRMTRPIVASNIGGFAELLADGENALLVPSGDVGALTTAMGRIIRDDDLRARLAAGMAKSVERIPSWEAIGSATAELYSSALAGRMRHFMADAAE